MLSLSSRGSGTCVSSERGAASAARTGEASPSLAAALGIVLLLALSFPGPAAAQEVPASEFGGDEASEKELGWGGTADFGLTMTSGNSETTSVSLGAQATREFAQQQFSFSLSHVRTTEDGEEVANRGEAASSYRYFPDRRFYFTARTSGSFNEPAGLDLRLAPGAGAGYLLAAGGSYQLSAEAGGTWIRDSFTDGSTVTSFNYAVAQSFSLDLNESTSLEQDLRYNPRADDLSDYLLHAELTLTTEITDVIGLRVTFIDDFDATPFEGGPEEGPAEQNDITFITGVSFSW